MNILNKTTALVVTSFAVLFTAVFTGFFVFQDSAHGEDKRIKISPELNINAEIVNCLNDEDALTVQIKTPKTNQEFKENENIKYEGSVAFKCLELLGEQFKQDFNYQWFINSETKPFSETISGDIGKKTPGNYTLRFEVILKLEGLEDTKKEAEVKFKVVAVVEEESNVLGTTPSPTPEPPPPEPPPPTNKAPTGQILRPKTGSTFNATQYDAKQGVYYVTVGLAGAGTDPEDGTLSGTFLKWYYQKPGSGKIYIGAGTGSSVNLSAPFCGNTIYTIFLDAIDSKGALHESSINVTVYAPCLF